MFHSRELEVKLRVHEGKLFSARGRFYGLVREQKFLFLLTMQRYGKERALANYFHKKTRKKARLNSGCFRCQMSDTKN